MVSLTERAMEDIEAIRQLKARYCLYVDQRNEDAWVSLFTEDAAWESDKLHSRGPRGDPHTIQGHPDLS
jgi:SnoaL-like domain